MVSQQGPQIIDSIVDDHEGPQEAAQVPIGKKYVCLVCFPVLATCLHFMTITTDALDVVDFGKEMSGGQAALPDLSSLPLLHVRKMETPQKRGVGVKLQSESLVGDFSNWSMS